MKRSINHIIRFGVATLLIGASILAAIFWLLPVVHTLRKDIDGNRASIEIIRQQRSNLASLSREIETIRQEQAKLEEHIWLFSAEDDFFTAMNVAASANQVTITSPSIADATPTGAILPRSGSVTITGTIANTLNAVTTLQHQERLIVIQKVSITPGASPDTVVSKITFTTLWQ
jgi:septal ring factor EnvC (AmiA/AmiB activator)